MACSPRSSLLRLASLSRLVVVCLAVAAQVSRLRWSSSDGSFEIVAHYDATEQLRLDQAVRECPSMGPVQRALAGAFGWVSHWDGAHFLHAASTHGGYEVDKETAFFPGLPSALTATAGGLQIITSTLTLGTVTLCWHTALLLACLMLSLALLDFNVMLLHALSSRVLVDPLQAYIATVCFIFSPAGVFMSACYTEGPFLALALGGMTAREDRRPWLSACLFALSTAVRANGWIFAGFFVFDAICATYRAKRGALGSVLVAWLRTAVCAAIVVAPYILLQLHFARRFCASDVSPPLSPSYCDSFFPSVYSHVQRQYWNVGFFRYYELKQLPNFLFALPMWTLSLLGIATYARANPLRFLTLGMLGSTPSEEVSAASTEKSEPAAPSFISSRLLVYIYLWCGLFFVCVTVLHVQVSTRFLSACPAVYWFAAHLLLRPESHAASASWLSPRKLFTLWSTLFVVVGTVLFSTFLPWT